MEEIHFDLFGESFLVVKKFLVNVLVAVLVAVVSWIQNDMRFRRAEKFYR